MKSIIAGIFGVVVALFGLTVVFGSWYTIDQTQRGVILRNGAVVGTAQPGLGFKMPMIDSVAKIDMQTRKSTYGIDPKTGQSIMEAYSADSQPAFLRVSVTYHVAPDRVTEMYSRFGGDYESAVARLIEPQVFARTKVVFGQYTASRAISSRGALNTDVAKAITEAIAYEPTFVIENVQIENLTFSGDYIKSVEQRMQAEVEVQRLQQNLAREKVQADITVTQAKAKADAVVAQAKADAEALKLRGDAEASAIEARGKALGSNPNLVALYQAEKWNGVLPVTMIPGGSVPMLSIPK